MDHESLFTHVKGDKKTHDIKVYALSTCGFCKRGLAFLKDNSIQFKYVYVDELAQDIKDAVKSDLFGKFHETMRYPFLVLNDEKCLIGFVEEEWGSILL